MLGLCTCIAARFLLELLLLLALSAAAPPSKQPQLLHQRLDRKAIRLLQQQREEELWKHHQVELWNRLFQSVEEQPDPIPLTTKPLPPDFPPGCLLRLGPNGTPAHDAFMDGDGMIHCVTFPPPSQGVPHYSSAYVETRGRTLEQISQNNRRFGGTLGSVPRAIPMLRNLVQNALTFRTLQAQKDTCNTGLAISGNRILALMEQCPPCEMAIHRNGRIETLQHTCRLDGAVAPALLTGGNLSAHGLTDPATGERIHVSYRTDEPPYLRVDIFDSHWKRRRPQSCRLLIPEHPNSAASTQPN